MFDVPLRHHHAPRDDNMESGGENSDDVPVETLVAGRARRVTAGNRMSSMLQQVAQDDDLELLFEEEEGVVDEEFEGEEGGANSDEDLGDSSDDEGQDAAGAGDEFDGENEIQRQAREERKKKRKAHEMFKRPRLAKVKGRTGHAIGTLSASAARSKKKSERVSWLPTTEEGPVRSSTRRQTVQNKEVVHLRMQESEKKRRQTIKVMEAAAKRKEAAKPKAMTQEDRLAEAARVEKSNAKSLNRWEAEEKQRAEDQKARLEALQNRQLEGPVISWWSGPARWQNDKIIAIGARYLAIENTRTSSVYHPGTQPITALESVATAAKPMDTPYTKALAGDHTVTATTTMPNNVAAAFINPSTFQSPPEVSGALPVRPQIPSFPWMHAPATHRGNARQEGPSRTPTLNYTGAPVRPESPPMAQIAVRNLVRLINMDPNLSRGPPELQNLVLFKRKAMKPTRHVPQTCAITGYAARYRDPTTGLPYANAYAYGELQKLCAGGSRWSEMLGCYVGPTTGAARGVPEGFHTPARPG